MILKFAVGSARHTIARGVTVVVTACGGGAREPGAAQQRAPGDAGAVRVDAGLAALDGPFSPEHVQAVMRASLGLFRPCYENGLRNSPGLHSRVSVKFVITASGHVSSAADESSDEPDESIVRCVVDKVRGLRFAEPGRPSVTIVYPIIFTPGE